MRCEVSDFLLRSCAELRYTRLYWFEDAFQRPVRGASLYKAVLVRGRIPTPRSRGFAIQGCTGSRTHSNAPFAGLAIQGCTGSRTHSNASFAGLRCTRLYWFEDAFQRPARGGNPRPYLGRNCTRVVGLETREGICGW